MCTISSKLTIVKLDNFIIQNTKIAIKDNVKCHQTVITLMICHNTCFHQYKADQLLHTTERKANTHTQYTCIHTDIASHSISAHINMRLKLL